MRNQQACDAPCFDPCPASRFPEGGIIWPYGLSGFINSQPGGNLTPAILCRSAPCTVILRLAEGQEQVKMHSAKGTSKNQGSLQFRRPFHCHPEPLRNRFIGSSGHRSIENLGLRQIDTSSHLTLSIIDARWCGRPGRSQTGGTPSTLPLWTLPVSYHSSRLLQCVTRGLAFSAFPVLPLRTQNVWSLVTRHC